ncbi:S41 family peptidase [Chitinimonas sp. BJB300]|uniref:S41 family peptidase n=1 Tax=Chitinimonas sp. BJB300 TaxID=1559339 RepID=UPI000C10184D|nr:S41 family peptidase [Chitinimonas sp. BJB300]PHV09911.1 peptidase S41 [Chitinimonas sp. BJB300]TSJ87348.1 peptidase S41 [Chitinimonas sp. BJB300]
MKNRFILALGWAGVLLGGTNLAVAADREPTRLLRQPSMSRDHLAFVYAGDIWLTDRNGQSPVRLTAHPATESAPQFSPDGQWIAFSAHYDNNTDVYVVSVNGGQAKRLTWHPGADVVNGWSADGKRVLFASNREVGSSRSNQLYEVALEGGAERKVMEAVAYTGKWSGDGLRLAYQPYRPAYIGPSGWRQSRGGSTPPIWVINPATNVVEKVPHVNATDGNPMWLGQSLYFISDRADGADNLFAYSSDSKTVRQLTHEMVWDIRHAGAYGQHIVYEVGGVLKELDVASGQSRDIPVHIAPQAVQARSQWKDATKTITSAQLSPSGKRVLLSARGEIFAVPVKDGSTRNLTATADVRESDGLWSRDGQRVAYLSGADMQQGLLVRDQAGLTAPRRYALGKDGYFTLLAWSPDMQTIVYHDNHLNLYAMALDKGRITRIDTSLRRQAFKVSFSADSRWLAYTTQGENYFSQIRVYDFQSGKHSNVTDGLSHADSPMFAASDYLYFTASTNSGTSQVFLDMSTQDRVRRSGIYAAVLAANGKSPLLPRSGDEEPPKKDKAGIDAAPDKGGKDGKGDKAGEEKDKPKPVRIDFEGLQQRIVPLPLAERDYDSLAVAADGALFYLEHRSPAVSNEPPEAENENDAVLYRFDFAERESKAVTGDLTSFGMSADGKKLLLQYAGGRLSSAEAGVKLDAKPIGLGQVRMLVNPQQEWRQIFDEAWWMEQQYFYDPKLHGMDWQAVYARYLPLLKHVQRREDLNELLAEMIGELQVGHNRVMGGDIYQEPSTRVGLLGADFALENGRYRIKTLYRGDRWNPFLKAPLAVPGLGVKEGDYLLAVNGRPLDANQNLYALLDNTLDKQTVLSVSGDPSGKGARNITVEPIGNEGALRLWAWVERNRQYVEAKTGGKVAYVYLPDTAGEGFKYFNRMFFAQVDKQAVILDDRRNSGGQAANYVVDVLARPYLAGWKDRDGLVFETPGGAIYGPKVMLINQDAGSGGDFLPYAFKRMGLGPLIGTRTWGGLIGISANPNLIDGGVLTVPFFRFFTPENEWRIENEGVAPDIEVALEPDAVNQGRDTQLDAAIDVVMDKLKQQKPLQRGVAPAMPTALGK